jgi:hypothetical protein
MHLAVFCWGFPERELPGCMAFEIAMVETGNRTSAGVRAYLWLSVLSLLYFLGVAYWAIAFEIPFSRFPARLGLWMCGTTGLFSAIPLAIGLWTLRPNAAPRRVLIAGKILGAFVASIFILSAIGYVHSKMAMAR